MVHSVLILSSLLLLSAPAAPDPAMLDLTRATVVTTSKLSLPESKAVKMLVEEVEKRSRIQWDVKSAAPKSGPQILVERIDPLNRAIPEGYTILSELREGAPTVVVLGADARGVLFGVGRLLRELRMERDRITVLADLKIDSSPRYPIRGHQLGYRPKTNSYDGWDLPQWEQYIRDLAVFGANAVELIPPRSDDDPDSPHFPKPPMEMMIGMSRLLDEYGLDCWIWYPAMDPDYANPKAVDAAVKEWGEVFRKLPRVDAVFVPGGDPGHTQPKVLMALLEKQTANLHRFHPKAQMWVSPQGFNAEWMDEFLAILRDQRPKWLTGIVFGPQVRMPLPKLRAAIPKQYAIRHYPDITHSRQSEYPPPDWDLAYAVTEGREGINPRPTQEAAICRLLSPYTSGAISYSEGCNDDVNKAVWSALLWNPNADVKETLREYSRYFIGPQFEESVAQGLLNLERNWVGPLAANSGVDETLAQFQAMEKSAAPQVKQNWRFQQALYRAYYDAYVRSRLLTESAAEERAIDKLRDAAKDTDDAMDAAEAVLDDADPRIRLAALPLRSRIFELAEALFNSIHMQLSVPRYAAIAEERGANLDSIDAPLNNRVWLKQQFAEIRALKSDTEQVKRLDAIVHWTDPGPGGFYDEPGNPLKRPHLIVGPGFSADPGNFDSARVGFGDGVGRIQWRRNAESLYDAPLHMRYTGLDSAASYRLRVVYGADSPQRRVRCMAGELQVHPYIPRPFPQKPLEFDIPAGAIRNGELNLTWNLEPGLGGNGRGCQLCEVWLIRK